MNSEWTILKICLELLMISASFYLACVAVVRVQRGK